MLRKHNITATGDIADQGYRKIETDKTQDAGAASGEITLPWDATTGVCGRDDNCLGRPRSVKKVFSYATIGGQDAELYVRYLSDSPQFIRVEVGAFGASAAQRMRAAVTGATKLDQRIKLFRVQFLMQPFKVIHKKILVY